MELYISSYEYSDFDIPRKVLQYHKIKLEGKNCLIIEVDRPLIGQKYGLLNDITKFYLINRVDEQAFDKFKKYPIDVYVLIQKKDNTASVSSLLDLQNIAWACIYNNQKDAFEHRII